MAKRAGIGVLVLLLVALGAAAFFQRQIGEAVFDRAAAARFAGEGLAFGDGLHLLLCGTGSPLPNASRAGPCSVVIAGEQAYVVDIGEGGARNLNLMQFDIAGIDALLLTHFHSDHIDGMGPLALLYWTMGTATQPLPVHGPTGIEAVIEGFNAFYAADMQYRIAHHGTEIVPESGGGAQPFPFALADTPVTVIERAGLTVTAFRVDHDPVRPAVGYRFDYKGRSIVISGDAAKTPALERAARGADILVHDALQPRLVGSITGALDEAGIANTAQITRDILDYHASPEEAAASAQAAGARMLVLSHLVPPLPSSLFYPAFLGDAAGNFDGEIVVGEDGMLFSLPAETETIDRDKVL